MANSACSKQMNTQLKMLQARVQSLESNLTTLAVSVGGVATTALSATGVTADIQGLTLAASTMMAGGTTAVTQLQALAQIVSALSPQDMQAIFITQAIQAANVGLDALESLINTQINSALTSATGSLTTFLTSLPVGVQTTAVALAVAIGAGNPSGLATPFQNLANELIGYPSEVQTALATLGVAVTAGDLGAANAGLAALVVVLTSGDPDTISGILGGIYTAKNGVDSASSFLAAANNITQCKTTSSLLSA